MSVKRETTITTGAKKFALIVQRGEGRLRGAEDEMKSVGHCQR